MRSPAASFGFIENHCQWDAAVRFYAKHDGIDVWVMDDRIVYDVYQGRNVQPDFNVLPGVLMPIHGRGSVERRGHVIVMQPKLGGGSLSARGVDYRVGAINYISGGACSGRGITTRSCAEVHLVPSGGGAWMRLYVDDGRPRYDVIVPPGIDPAGIRLAFDGERSLRVDELGELVIGTSLGDLLQRNLRAFQGKEHAQKRVGCVFRIIRSGEVGFNVGEYDRSSELVIDPLVWSTFVGGTAYERSTGVARGADGSVYSCGYTASSNFPATVGAYDAVHAGSTNAFVMKLAADGATLRYATFIGGQGGAWAHGMTIDNAGRSCVVGSAGPGYPTTTGAYQSSPLSGVDAFVTILDATGSALAYSTCLGGSATDRAHALAVDASNRIHITGCTSSGNFPTTRGAYDESHNGGRDVFIAQLVPSAGGEKDLLYSTFVGGTGGESGNGIAVDGAGRAYIVGTTIGADYPTTLKAFDRTHNGDSDIVVTGIAPRGNGAADLVYSTFAGGDKSDRGSGIAVGANGDIYVSGSSASSNYPVTRGGFDSSYNGAGDGICTRFSSNGEEDDDLIYSTYLGGTGFDAANAIALDETGDVLIVGVSASSNFPTTSSGYDATYNGDTDVVVLRLSTGGNDADDIIYSTFVGGGGADEGLAIVPRGSDSVYVAGATSSTGFPTTHGAYDVSYNGGADAFVALLALPSSGSLLAKDRSERRELEAPVIRSGAGAREWSSSRLFRCLPNPACNSVRIEYRIEREGDIRLELFGARGEQVGTLLAARQSCGTYSLLVSTQLLADGLYFVRLRCDTESRLIALQIAR